MEDFKLFDAEYRLMDLVWEHQPINSTALSRLCQEKLGWKKSTTINLAHKLGERGIVRNEAATVTALAGMALRWALVRLKAPAFVLLLWGWRLYTQLRPEQQMETAVAAGP